MKTILSQNRASNLVGREKEIATLMGLVLSPDPAVVHVHGIGGIGKSSLLLAFALVAQNQGIHVVQMDCRVIEPSEKGFLSALGKILKTAIATVDVAASALSKQRDTVVLAIDSYEVFRMMDTWLRITFIPALTDTIRVLLFGREPPVSMWLVATEWQGVFHTLNLGPIDDAASEEILRMSGVGEDDIPRICSFARGHPLALRLAAAATLERPELDIETVAAQSVISKLTQTYVADISNLETRYALEAASVVRRMNKSLLKYVLPSIDVDSTFEELQSQPFAELAHDGLVIHDSVQQAIASSLKATDPTRYREFRKRAREYYQQEVDMISQSEVWRHSADMLYLVEHPLVHDAFFPSNLQPISLEPMKPADANAVKGIISQHEGQEGGAVLRNWMTHAPETFKVAKQKDGSIAGFYILYNLLNVPRSILRSDPVARQLLQQLQDDPCPPKQDAFNCRRWLDAKTGEKMSEVIGAMFLDVKGYYVAMKPSMRRLYCTCIDHDEYAAIFQGLTFSYLENYTAELDGKTYHTDMLDFGPGLFNGWITRLVGIQLGAEEKEILDVEACELVIGEQRASLTPLELGVMQYLQQHEGDVVKRQTLLEEVWGYGNYSGSNVVDTKIRSLRKKLGTYAPSIETVSGIGYRFKRI